jgi:serine phosphatase RsbU (regulator of sigma subunit)/rhodanese-related sulfurtransferase
MEKRKSIDLVELDRLLNTPDGVTVIDVRSEEEFKEKHIPFAINLSVGHIEAKVAAFDLRRPIVTVCGTGGGRSDRAANFIRENYKVEAFFLEEGTFGWLKQEEEDSQKNKSALQKLIQRSYLSTDTEDEKIRKSTLLVMAFPFAIIGCIWGWIYIYNDLTLPGLIPLSYGIISLISIVLFLAFQNFNFFRFSQILLILLLPFFLQISLGGFVPSSSVILWTVISPLSAMAFYEVKQSILWFIAFVFVVVAAYFVNDHLPGYFNWNISKTFNNGMFLMNLVGVSLIVYLLQYYVFNKHVELKKSIEEKSAVIRENSKEITDSIYYAKRIQNTLLANENLLRSNLTDHFILYKPKDIVSGDFYWAAARNNKFYLAACDSTGHGVPGAFMSLLNISLLNEAVNERNILSPDEICGHVRTKLIESVSQEGGQDGMDGVLVCLDADRKTLSFAAAHNAPILIRNNEVIEFEADKMPIGKGERTEDFKQQTVDVKAGDIFYLFTDGYTDQFGGPKGKKFKYKQMRALLQSICNQSLAEQKRILDAVVGNWKGQAEQTDDILVIGFKI